MLTYLFFTYFLFLKIFVTFMISSSFPEYSIFPSILPLMISTLSTWSRQLRGPEDLDPQTLETICADYHCSGSMQANCRLGCLMGIGRNPQPWQILTISDNHSILKTGILMPLRRAWSIYPHSAVMASYCPPVCALPGFTRMSHLNRGTGDGGRFPRRGTGRLCGLLVFPKG